MWVDVVGLLLNTVFRWGCGEVGVWDRRWDGSFVDPIIGDGGGEEEEEEGEEWICRGCCRWSMSNYRPDPRVGKGRAQG